MTGVVHGAPEDSGGSSSSSLIMIHRHTARLIVYRSLTMPQPSRASELLWRDLSSIYTRAAYIYICIHMHPCAPFFLSARRPFLSASFVISPGSRCSRSRVRPPRLFRLLLQRCLRYVTYTPFFHRHSIAVDLRVPSIVTPVSLTPDSFGFPRSFDSIFAYLRLRSSLQLRDARR